jgi:hypothetical protein
LLHEGNWNFISSSLSGFAGSLGASGWSSVIGSRGASMISFGAIAGGVGAELSGGNFWQGALIGGVVAGLNHALHEIDSPLDNGDEFRKNADGTITATGGKKGGDTTDYLYDTTGKLIGTKSVTVLEAGDNMTADYSTYGLRLHTEGTGVTLSFGELSLTAITGGLGGRTYTYSKSLGFSKFGDFYRTGPTVVSNNQRSWCRRCDQSQLVF